MSEKRCPKCGKMKPFEDFYRKRNAKDGRQGYCKPCQHDVNRPLQIERYKRFPDEYRRARNTAYARYREQRVSYSTQWNKDHPWYARSMRARYKARKRGATVVDLVNLQDIYEGHGGNCGICGSHVPEDRVCFDHIRPLKHGGAHIAGNIQPAHKWCNQRKGDNWTES